MHHRIPIHHVLVRHLIRRAPEDVHEVPAVFRLKQPVRIVQSALRLDHIHARSAQFAFNAVEQLILGQFLAHDT